MPTVKIVEKGFETYNGVIEGVQFTNGVSEEPLSQFSAERVGAFIKVVDADNPDTPLGLGYRMANARSGGGVAPRAPLERIERTKTGKTKQPVKPAKKVHYDFSREDLERVADKEGIQGLRKVAEQYDVRGRSIAEIVESLMAKKANQEAKDAAETPRAKEAAEAETVEEAKEPTIDSLLDEG